MLVGGGGEVGGAGDWVDGDGKARSFFQQGLTTGEGSEADFGTLQVEQNAGMHVQFGGGVANEGNQGAAIIAGAVRGIETEDIDACAEQPVHGSGRIAGGPECGYDFGGAPADSHIISLHHNERPLADPRGIGGRDIEIKGVYL
jgi:hypothetical protein